MSLASLENFQEWFISQGGTFDSSLISFSEFEEGGRGVIALRDISVHSFRRVQLNELLIYPSQENTTLFKLPRSLTLSTRTSTLKSRIPDEWKRYELGKGWVGLILCMLWEEGQEGGKWTSYFGIVLHQASLLVLNFNERVFQGILRLLCFGTRMKSRSLKGLRFMARFLALFHLRMCSLCVQIR